MKLATLRTHDPDGQLLIVSRDLTRCISAHDIAPTMQAALDRWDRVLPALEARSAALHADASAGSSFRPEAMAAPLPRAWQWLDGSAFPSHGALMQQAYDLPLIETDRPLMYQGMSHRFLSATEDVPFPSEADGIDFEGELGIVTGEVPMGTAAADTLGLIRLAVQINDWSLRVIAPIEMKTGFGWVQAKPACSMAPVAVTLDELGGAWRDGRIECTLEVRLHDAVFGAVPTTDMAFGFHDLVAHAARTRILCAGTIIGSGTVSSPDHRRTGSCCIAERRAIETIGSGKASTSFLRSGDTVAMVARIEGNAALPFGTIEQRVVQSRL